VRGGEGAPGEIPDGGPPVSERKSDLDKQITAAGGDDVLGSRALHLAHVSARSVSMAMFVCCTASTACATVCCSLAAGLSVQHISLRTARFQTGSLLAAAAVSITDAMRFNGAAPEIINGR